MPTAVELLALDVSKLAPRLRSREISPVELTAAYLDRIAQLDPRLRAYITITADLARGQALAAETEIAAGRWRGPFHGVPVALKDLCYTKGVRTTGGSKILADFVPDHDSTVWDRLRAAGAILLGKLNLHEFAYGISSNNPHWGTCRNPYGLDRIPGGSSGGSGAAIAARLAAATIGTDTGGSIRIPAALCGCVGLKPTWGRVSRYGVVPLSATLDHVGPITRSVHDAALMMNVIAGYDRNDSTSSREPVPDYAAALSGDIRGVRIGVIREFADRLSPEVDTSYKAALAQLAALGAQLDEVSIPAVKQGARVSGIITWVEAFELHERWMRERSQDYGADVRTLLEMGMATLAAAYVRAQRSRARILSDLLAAFEGRSVLVAPTGAIEAPRIADRPGLTESADVARAFLRFNAVFDVTGQPAIAVPTGLSPAGLPLSMQFIARPLDEVSILRVADAYERARAPLTPPNL